jgi:hypothetical protein
VCHMIETLDTDQNRIKMTNLFIIVFISFIVGCSSQTTDKGAKVEIKKKDTIAKSNTSNIVGQHKDSSIIYDTIVFTDNMHGELLDEKFALSQPELTFYKKFIISKKINKLIVLKEESVKTEIKYLGKIKGLNNKTSYHVVTNFRIIGIGRMLSPRGRSEVAFVNEAKNKIIIYNLPMPQNLPKYIKNNILFFEYDNIRAGISIFGRMPPLLCLPQIGCN